MIRLVKGVLGGLLICACVSACSDDTMEGEGNEGLKENANPAYLTISFKASSASDSRSVDSRTDTEANTGDNHGDAEDSGHHDAGTDDENKVKTALVIAHPTTTNVAFAKLYSVTEAPTPNAGTEATANNKNFYVSESGIAASSDNATPIELAIGEYKLLVVVNPPAELYKDAFEGNELSTTVLAKVKALYEKALDGNYEVKDVTNYLAGPATGEDPKYFMMANKAEKTVKLDEDDTPDSPEHVTVVVERAASKITYRQLAADNKYSVTIETQRQAETMDAAIKVNDAWTYAKLNLASDLLIEEEGKEPYCYNNDLAVLYLENEDGTTTVQVYRRTDTPRTVKGENDSDVEAYECVGPLTPVSKATYEAAEATAKAGCFVVEDDAIGDDGALKADYDLLRSLNFSYDAAATERSTYYVTIEGYALTNLAKSVNYVRHTVEYSGTAGLPFGTVEDKYLWTPNWAAKNAVDFSVADFDEAGFNSDAEGWYYNPLHKVAEETHVLQLPTDNNTNFSVSTEGGSVQYFKLMPEVKTENDAAHSNQTDYTQEGTTVPAIGNLLGYCLENSTDITHQTHGLSTGIVFVASITDEEGNIPTLYRFNGYVYESLADIQRAYGKAALAKNDTEELTFQTLVDNEQSATKEQLAHYGIVKYEGGKCYYYTTEIKHFDNGDNSNMGYMEYAIMRNNIYSLAIKGIRFIGDPFLEPVPGKTNESGKAALDIEVQIVPWIVRYNDIEF